jgi:two-component system chemotaxis response regulator CheY
MRALLVDDSKAVRTILGRIAKGIGCETTEAGNGQEALDKMREGVKFDIAFVDINMPVMNGLDFVKTVRSDKVNDEMIILVVSSESEGTTVARALLAGANEYVMKPFTKEMILEKLELNGLQAQ